MIKKNLLSISIFTLFTTYSLAVDMSTCIGCHGKHFEKPSMGLSRVVKDLAKEEIHTALMGYKNDSKGGSMQSVMVKQMSRFSNEEIELLTQNIVDAKITIETNTTEESNNSTNKIEELEVNIGSCIACHGEKLEKPAMGISRIVNQMSKDDIIASIYGYKDGSYGGAMKALMAGVAMKLTQEEIEAIGEKFGIKNIIENSQPKR